MTPRHLAVALLVGVTLFAARAGPSVRMTVRNTTKGCPPAPASRIGGMPSGSIWDGQGHCFRTDGLLLTKPVTIENATFIDSRDLAPLRPIIGIFNTSHVTVKNVSLTGANTAGTYHSALVGGAAIDVRSSSEVTLKNVTTDDTFGDGLTLFDNPRHGQDDDVVVNHYKVTNAGRCGFSPVTVTDLSVNHLRIVSSATPAIDFESDLRGVGMSGFVNIANSTWNGPVYAQEYDAIGGYIDFDNDTAQGGFHISMGNPTTRPNVQFDGGSIMLRAQTHDVVKSPFTIIGDRVVVDGTHITRAPYHGHRPQTPSYLLEDAPNTGTPASLILEGGTAFPPPLPKRHH